MQRVLKRIQRTVQHWLDPEYDAGSAEEKTVITVDKEDYELLRKVIANNNLYFLFANVDDISDFFFRKYKFEHGKEYYVGLDDDEEFHIVYDAFRKEICGDDTNNDVEQIENTIGGETHE